MMEGLALDLFLFVIQYVQQIDMSYHITSCIHQSLRLGPLLLFAHYSMTNPIPPMCFALDWFRASMPPVMGAAR
jgi:hypothetical protein